MIGDPSDIGRGLPEVHQQAKVEIRSPQGVQSLGRMDIIELLAGLEFNQKISQDQQVGGA